MTGFCAVFCISAIMVSIVQVSNFCLLDVQSLNNKLLDLPYILRSYDFDVICVTETWLHAAVPNSIILDGRSCSVYRIDRPAASGCSEGGVCIVTSN
jgi:hypothetical protein